MTKKEKVCLEDSQIKRLQTDTAKLAKGINEDICPTVEEMYNENVPKEIRISKAQKKKKAKDHDPDPIHWIGKEFLRGMARKVRKGMDDIF